MLFVICASSGAGKTTIIRELFKQIPGINFSVSATTRKKRQGETDGKDYFYLTKEDFERKKSNNEFIETEEVHGHGIWSPARLHREAAVVVHRQSEGAECADGVEADDQRREPLGRGGVRGGDRRFDDADAGAAEGPARD